MTVSEKIEEVRKIASEVLGFRFRDTTITIESNIGPTEYCIKINGEQYADTTDDIFKALEYTREVLVKKLAKYTISYKNTEQSYQ